MRLAYATVAVACPEPDRFSEYLPEVLVELAALLPDFPILHLGKTAGQVDVHDIAAIAEHRVGKTPHCPAAAAVEGQG